MTAQGMARWALAPSVAPPLLSLDALEVALFLAEVELVRDRARPLADNRGKVKVRLESLHNVANGLEIFKVLQQSLANRVVLHLHHYLLPVLQHCTVHLGDGRARDGALLERLKESIERTPELLLNKRLHMFEGPRRE